MVGDFLRAEGLSSFDFKLNRVAAWTVGAGAGMASPKSIPRQAAGVVFMASGPVAISIEGNAVVANPTDGALSLPTGITPLIGLELDADLVPFAFNGGAGAIQVCMLVFTKRRVLERQQGQV